MRWAWMLVGVVAGFSSAAAASPVWTTVAATGDQIGSSGETFDAPGQVVLDNNGDIAVQAEASGNDAVLLYNASGAQIVAQANGTYSDFSNLAENVNAPSSAQLSFVTTYNTGDGGILQFAPSGNSGTLSTVVGDGQAGYSFTNVGTYDSAGVVPLQVNQSGTIFFNANQGGNAVIGMGSASQSVSNAFPPAGGSSLTLADVNNRIAVTTSGQVAALLSNGATVGLYTFAAGAASQGSPINGANYSPIGLFGAASVGGVTYTAYLAANQAGNYDVVVNQGSTPISLATAGPVPSNANTQYSGSFGGEVTPNGKFAFYLPDSSGNVQSVQYVNLTTPAPTPITIAAVGDSVTDSNAGSNNIAGLTISSLRYLVGSPMINDNGLVVFDGTLSDGNQALFDSQAGQASPNVLLADGDVLTIDGQADCTIDDIYASGLQNDSDYYKNSLNDDNDLAIAVYYQYGDPNNPTYASAILYTSELASVPEPASLGLLLAGLPLLARRRSRRA